MELVIRNVKQKDKKDFEQFLDNFCKNFSTTLKEKIQNTPQMKVLKWTAGKVGVDVTPFLENNANWILEKGIYHLTIMSLADKVPDSQRQIKVGIEKELQRVDKNIKVEMK
jgi:hypothetical protein